MSPFRKIFGSLMIVGLITAGGAACSSDDSSKSADSAASIDAWCKKFEQAEKDDEGAELEESAAIFKDLAKDAPGAIRDDMDLIASAFTEMQSVDFEDESAVKALEEKYDEDEIDAATNRIEVFAKDECGLDMNAE